MAELAVVLVTWNVRDLVRDAISSLQADLDKHGPDAIICVVDSASTDGTPDMIAATFPDVRLIRSDTNLGFGRANNLGLRALGFGTAASHELPAAVYLLNPDTITHEGATRALYDVLMADPRAGLVGARLSYEDGSFQHGAYGFPGLRQLWVEFFPRPGRLYEHRFNGRYPRSLYDAGQPFDVDFPLGATMMLRREVIQATGMFDEQFFMYCEEIDWAWRIHAAGWRVLCVPAAHVTHLSGKSTGQVRGQSVINLWTSRLRLYRKHYPRWKSWLARGMIAAGMQRRIWQGGPPELLDAYRQVRQLALRGNR